jgi:micrococcal nuclease
MDTLLTIIRDVLLELLVLLQLFTPGQAFPIPSQGPDVPLSAIASTTLYTVVKVVDGDTIHVDIDGKKETVRLIGINTPETVDPRRPVECFGKEASDTAKELMARQRVRVETDPTQGELDKYGRLLAYVYLENGIFVNKYMVEEGYAYEYTYRVPYKYQSEFKAAQKSAEVNGRGLWAPGVCEK